MDLAIRLLVVVGRWVDASVRAAGWWALAVLVAGVVSPTAVLAEPGARLRWVLVAAGITGALMRALDRPVPQWLGGAPPER